MASMGPEVGLGTERLFDDVARQIRSVLRHTGLERTRAIGALVLDRFFDGSVAAWRERRNRKNNSVRRLAERPGCPLSRSSLNQAVGIHAVTTALPAILKLLHIEASHIGVVLPLPQSDQERWLHRANAERWSVRELKDAIHRARRTNGERRGRPRASPAQRALTATRASFERLEATVARLAGLDLDAGCLRALQELSERLAALRVQLSSLGRVERVERRDSQVRLTGPGVEAALEQADDETAIAS